MKEVVVVVVLGGGGVVMDGTNKQRGRRVVALRVIPVVLLLQFESLGCWLNPEAWRGGEHQAPCPRPTLLIPDCQAV